MGHGPSSAHVSRDIESDWVVRLRRAIPFLGTRTDAICSSQQRYEQKGAEFWYLEGDILRMCVRSLKKYNPSLQKPSTGLCAAIIARNKFPKGDIGVIGFDYTLHPDTAINWRHDQYAEHECIKTLGVIEIV